MKASTLVVVYNSYRDPLFQNLILRFISKLSIEGDYTFHLITFEQTKYGMSSQEMKEEHERLEKHRIHWHPLRFRTGRLLILKKALDFMHLLWLSSKIILFEKVRLILAFANVAGAISHLMNIVWRRKLLIYSYELHADFMLELGHWKEESLSYQCLSRLERIAGKSANYIITGTESMKQKLLDWGSKASIHVHGTPTDTRYFHIDDDLRADVREKLEITHRPVIVYMGKFGGLYYKAEEARDFFLAIQKGASNMFFLIISPDGHEELHTFFAPLGKSNYFLTESYDKTELRAYLNAGDYGVILIPPTPAQRFRSPTKTGEYLACGLRLIVLKGVSEDDEMVYQTGVGVVLDNLDGPNVNRVLNDVKSFQGAGKPGRRDCSVVGSEYRGLESVHRTFSAIYRSIFEI